LFFVYIILLLNLVFSDDLLWRVVLATDVLPKVDP
jgi:hypothetical protein